MGSAHALWEGFMFISLLRKRRSIRRYSQVQIETEKLGKLVEAALRAPSSRSVDPCEFIVVTDRTLLKKLAKAKEHGSAFLEKAACGIVVCADPKRSDVWIEDASIASVFVHLAAASLELGSCWIQIRERIHSATKSAESYVAETLGIPETLRVESIVGVGYPDEQMPGHPKESLEFGKVHLNAYGRPYAER
jgi:nitroreductase